MARLALVVGVGHYREDFEPLPWSKEDADAIERLLINSEIGGFSVQKLIDPHRQQLTEAIESLFTGRRPEDTLIFYFSGHGVKDERGRLHLAVPQTCKNENGELFKASALSVSVIHDCMERSRSRNQIVILDSCFSGAFAEGMAAKDDGTLDIRGEFGAGDGRAVLTAASSTQHAFGHSSGRLSIYTQSLVEGISTGSADINNDGWITVDELHEYAKTKMRAMEASMTPKIFTVKEGYKIPVVRAPRSDPNLRYLRQVEEFARQHDGTITPMARLVLDNLRQKLSLDEGKSRLIELQVLQPYENHKRQVELLRAAVRNAGVTGIQVDRLAIERYRQQLGLSGDVLERLITDEIQRERESPTIEDHGDRPEQLMTRSSSMFPWIVGGTIGGVLIASILVYGASTDADSNDRASSSTPITPSSGAGSVREVFAPPPQPAPLDVPQNPALTSFHWVVRVSADSSLSQAEENARRVAASNALGHKLAVQLVRRGSLYYVLVGNYTSESAASQDRPILRNILGEGGIVHSMSSWCPSFSRDGNVLICH